MNQVIPIYLIYLTTILNVSICAVVCYRFLEIYFNAYNTIDNLNRMHQSGLALYKYWVTQSEYFRVATSVELVMRITDEKSFYVMVIKRTAGERNQLDIKSTGPFITALRTPFQLIVEVQILFSLPCLLMIVPNQKYIPLYP